MKTQKLLWQARTQRYRALLALLFSRREVVVACMILIFWGIGGLFSSLITSYDPYAIHLTDRLQPISITHFFGTDELGRDIWTRVMYGGRLTFLCVLFTAGISSFLGLFLGMLAGYLGRGIDTVISRLIDLFLTIPRLMLTLVFLAILGPGLLNAAFAVAFSSWPYYARIARSEAISLRNAEFIQAAKLQGATHWRILCHYLAPLCFSSLLIRLSLDLGGVILSIAAIGFLGMGVQPPGAEWGTMAAQGRTYLLSAWWISVMPGLAIFSVTLAFNIIGGAIRDITDPKRETLCP